MQHIIKYTDWNSLILYIENNKNALTFQEKQELLRTLEQYRQDHNKIYKYLE